jgi:fructose-1,6-bisphosphatase I
MILVIAKAGGIATTGTKRILDIVPKSIHDRSGVYLGSKDDVLDVVKFYEAETKSG